MCIAGQKDSFLSFTEQWHFGKAHSILTGPLQGRGLAFSAGGELTPSFWGLFFVFWALSERDGLFRVRPHGAGARSSWFQNGIAAWPIPAAAAGQSAAVPVAARWCVEPLASGSRKIGSARQGLLRREPLRAPPWLWALGQPLVVADPFGGGSAGGAPPSVRCGGAGSQ